MTRARPKQAFDNKERLVLGEEGIRSHSLLRRGEAMEKEIARRLLLFVCVHD